MLIRTLPAVLLCVGLMTACLRAAEEATPAENARLVLAEDFSTAASREWRVAKGRWQIVDGAWQGAELPADKHGAVARRNVALVDGVVEFDFRLDGAKAISLSFNGERKHVCRLAIRPAGFQVLKDDSDHAGPDERVVLHDEPMTLAPATWYHARVELSGMRMTAQVGKVGMPGKWVGGEHPAIAVPKTNLGFTVSGETASFRNLRVKAE